MRWRWKASSTIRMRSRTSRSPTAGASPARRSGSGARSAIRRISSSSRDSSTSWRWRRSSDPFEFRRRLLAQPAAPQGVLEAAADKAGWGKPLPAGVHRGIAVAQSFGSYVAEVAEVSVGDDGTPKVHRVVAVVDCGMTVNPRDHCAPDRRRDRLRAERRAVRQADDQGRPHRAEQFPRLPGAADQRDAEGRGPHPGRAARSRAASANPARRRSRRRWSMRSMRRPASGCARCRSTTRP